MNWYKKAQISLIFEHIYEDFHNKQYDYVLAAKDSTTQQLVGMIEYSLFQDNIYINNILVKKDLRRQGIGIQMVEEIILW